MVLASVRTFMHRSAWNRHSQKFTCRILHNHVPIPLESPSPDTPLSPTPLELVTPMDRYARLWMRSCHKHLFAVKDLRTLSVLGATPLRDRGGAMRGSDPVSESDWPHAWCEERTHLPDAFVEETKPVPPAITIDEEEIPLAAAAPNFS